MKNSTIISARTIPFDTLQHLNPSLSVDKGIQPSVAMCSDYVIEAHKSDSKSFLWYTLSIKGQDSLSNQHHRICEGSRPSVALSSFKDTVVVVHESTESGKVGMQASVCGRDVRALQFASAQFESFQFGLMGDVAAEAFRDKKDQKSARELFTPAVALDGSHGVIACSTGRNQLVNSLFGWCSRENPGPQRLKHYSTEEYARGRTPSIAVSGKTVIEIHQSEKGGELVLMLGMLDSPYHSGSDKAVSWCQPYETSIKGSQPTISLAGTHGLMAYVDQSSKKIALRQLNLLEWDPSNYSTPRWKIELSDPYLYETGTEPAVAAAGSGFAMMFQYGSTDLRFASAVNDDQPFDERNTYTHWMRDHRIAIENRPLNMVALPGTHDSGTAAITWHSPVMKEQDLPDALNYRWFAGFLGVAGIAAASCGGVVMANWGKAQSLSIEKQLQAGIRYLDIRVAKDGNEFYLCHSMRSDNVDVLLREVSNFVAQPDNASEIVILDFQDVANVKPKDHDTLCNKIYLGLAGKLVSSALKPQSTVRQFWDGTGRVIVLYSHSAPAAQTYGFWDRSSSITSSWHNAQDADTLLQRLDAGLKRRSADDHEFFVSQGMLTPDAAMIGKGFIPLTSDPCSLKQAAKQTTPRVTNWVAKEKGKFNIVIVDWFQIDRGFAPTVIAKNGER